MEKKSFCDVRLGAALRLYAKVAFCVLLGVERAFVSLSCLLFVKVLKDGRLYLARAYSIRSFFSIVYKYFKAF